MGSKGPIDKLKVVANLNRFSRFIREPGAVTPSLLSNVAISNALNFNELILPYENLMYFGYLPHVFLNSLSSDVRLLEAIRYQTAGSKLPLC